MVSLYYVFSILVPSHFFLIAFITLNIFYLYACVHVCVHCNMDPYIRDFVYDEIETEIVDNFNQCSQVFKINEDFLNFKIMHNNIRSINKNLDEMKIILSQQEIHFDCIVLTETHQIENLALYNIEGYNLIYNEAKLNINDGVVIFLKDSFPYNSKIIKLHEISILKLEIFFNNKTVSIMAIYRSPSLDPSQFNLDLQSLLTNCTKTYDYELIVGDLNIDILKKCDYSAEYLNTLYEFGYVSLINKYTRVQGNTASCIDHIFLKTQTDHDLCLPLIILSDVTDHYSIALQIVVSQRINNSLEDKNKFVKYINYNKLKDILSQLNWSSVYNCTNVESATNKFTETILNKIKQCTYYKKISHKNIKRKEWMTTSLVNSVNHKNLLFIATKRNPENLELRAEYQNYKKNLKNLIEKRKVEYYKNLIEINKNNKLNIWKSMKHLYTKTNTNNKIALINNDQNEIITNNIDMANTFNKTFTEMGEKLAEKIVPDHNYSPKRKILQNSIYISYTDKYEITDIINSLKNKKSPGFDNIQGETLKHIVQYICDPLTYIINIIIDTGIVPSAFKTSVVRPIYKKGNKLDPSNYRPISLITNFAKIFEKIIKKRLTSYLQKYNIISAKQYGFQAGISTQDAIVFLTKKIYSSLDRQIPSLAVFLDLAKAFDTVSFSLLCESLEDLGIRGVNLKLFRNYLEDRIQYVSLNGVQSDPKTITYGVPQGTVLGPLLFIIYINNLFILETNGEIITFADDTVVYYKDSDWVKLKQKVETDFARIKQWFNNKILTINFDKTFFVPFSSYKNKLPPYNTLEINEDGQLTYIKSANSIKYLGIYIDSHFKWNIHMEYITKKLRSIIYLFHKVKYILNAKDLKILYYSLVNPHVTYAILGWGGVLNNHLKSVETLQKRFFKIILNKSILYPSDQLLDEINIFDIRQHYFYSVCVHTYRNKHLLQLPVHDYSTRQKSCKFVVEFMQKTIGQRSLNFLGPKIFSSLPHEITTHNTLNKFKKGCKRYIRQQSRENIYSQIDLKNN